MLQKQRGGIFSGAILFLLSFLLSSVSWGQTTTIGGTVNIYTPVTAIDTVSCPVKITVVSSSGFFVGDTVMLIQMKGANFDSSNTNTFGNIINLKGAGNYEIGRINAINTNTITLNGKLTNIYYVSGFVQLVRMRTYVNANVTASLTCQPWNGLTGGVLAFNVNNNLLLNANIDVTGKGFRGGTISTNPDGSCGSGSPGYYYPLSPGGFTWAAGGAQKGEGIGTISATKQAGRGPLVSGGGGGNKHNTGGGGGSNFTNGGKGGDGLSGCNHTTDGLGGVPLGSYYSNDKLFLGGGGGCGDYNNNVGTNGEIGGGIIIINAGSVSGNNYMVKANGNTVIPNGGAAADGAGGGGAGGAIFINTNTILSTFTAQANGGGGGNQNPSGYCVGPGGGGGTGSILTNLNSLSFITTNLVPGGPGVHIAGACIGSPYGATAGGTNTSGPLTNRSLVYTLAGLGNMTLSVVSASPLTCSGSTVQLTASGATTYSWQPGNMSGSVAVVSPTANTVYTIIGTSVGGCTNIGYFFQQVNPSPTVTVVSSNLICVGQSATLTASGAGSYTWLPGNTNGSQLVVSPTVTTTYTITGINNNSCTGVTYFTQVVNPLPVLLITKSASLVCAGTPVTLTVSGASNYTWQPSGSNSSTLSSIMYATTNYTATGASAAGCVKTATTQVAVKPVPSFNFSSTPITCASAGNATIFTSGGTGPFSYTWSPSAVNGSVSGNIFPGIYSVSVFDAGTGCSTVALTFFTGSLSYNGTVTATPSVACNGLTTGTAGIAVSGGSGNQTYSWTTTGGVQTGSVASNLGAGIHLVKVTDVLSNCTLTRTFQITQPPIVSVSIVASSPSVCLGGSIILNALGAGGTGPYNISWNGFPPGNNITVSQNIAGSYIYSVTNADANTCAKSATTSLLFVSNPTVTASSTSICAFAAGTLVAAGAATYTWTGGNMGATFVNSPGSSTQFTVTGTTQACTAAAVGSITVLPAPAASITSNAPVCNGDSLKLHGLGGIGYNWVGPNGYTSGIANPVINPAGTNMTGLYFLKVTGANTCTIMINSWIIVNPTPPVSAWSNTVCEGTNLNLQSAFVSGATYLWAGPLSFSASTQNPIISNATPGNTGNYTLILTSAQGCSNMAITHGSVVAHPLPFISTNAPLCYGGPLNLSGGGGTAYVWKGPNNYYSNQQNNTINNITAGGNYTLFVTYGPCVSDSVVNVVVNPLPVPIITSNNSPLCEGKTILVDASGGAGYAWSGPFGFTSGQQNLVLNNATMGNAGVYQLTVNSAANCTAVTNATVVVLKNPVPTIAGDTVCEGNPASLAVFGGNSYLWNGPSNFTSTAASITITNTANQSGIFTVAVTATNGCVVTATAALVAQAFPLPVPVLSAPSKVCANSFVQLQGGGGTIYYWRGPGTFTSALQNPTFTASELYSGGMYTLTVKNSNDCVASGTISIKVLPLPKGELLPSNNNLCAPFCSIFNLKAVNNTGKVVGVSYQMNKTSTTDSAAKFCFGAAGKFNVVASFRDSNNCVNTASVNIVALQKPRADFVFVPEKPIAGVDLVQFYNSSTEADGAGWTWISGNNDSVSTKDMSRIFKEAGNQPVVLLVKNKWGCIDTIVKVVRVEEEFDLYVPNAFTPNGDGLNDIFQPKGQGIKNYHIEIYSRWGQRVFATSNFADGWDGTFKGQECKSDVYTWKINFVDVSGNSRMISGHVTIIRGAPAEEE